MNISKIITYTNEEGDVEKADVNVRINSKNETRKYTVSIGSEYIVKPINPLKKKHRDRHVIVRKILDTHNGVIAQVQFKDTKRIGRVDIDELVPLN